MQMKGCTSTRKFVLYKKKGSHSLKWMTWVISMQFRGTEEAAIESWRPGEGFDRMGFIVDDHILNLKEVDLKEYSVAYQDVIRTVKVLFMRNRGLDTDFECSALSWMFRYSWTAPRWDISGIIHWLHCATASTKIKRYHIYRYGCCKIPYGVPNTIWNRRKLSCAVHTLYEFSIDICNKVAIYLGGIRFPVCFTATMSAFMKVPTIRWSKELRNLRINVYTSSCTMMHQSGLAIVTTIWEKPKLKPHGRLKYQSK